MAKKTSGACSQSRRLICRQIAHAVDAPKKQTPDPDWNPDRGWVSYITAMCAIWEPASSTMSSQALPCDRETPSSTSR